MTADVEPPESGNGRLATGLYLLGLGGFLLSTIAFAAALVLGTDLRPILAANALSAALLVAWAARDTYLDPDSEVTTVPGAVGTAMLLLAVYGLLAAAVVAVTSPVHGRLDLALFVAGAAVVAGVLAVVTFPLEVLVAG